MVGDLTSRLLSDVALSFPCWLCCLFYFLFFCLSSAIREGMELAAMTERLTSYYHWHTSYNSSSGGIMPFLFFSFLFLDARDSARHF